MATKPCGLGSAGSKMWHGWPAKSISLQVPPVIELSRAMQGVRFGNPHSACRKWLFAMAHRILHIIPTLDRAGAEKQLVLLAHGLPRDKFEAHVCALTRGGALQAE